MEVRFFFSLFVFISQNIFFANPLHASLQRVPRLADRFVQLIIKTHRQNLLEISLFFHFALASLYTSHLVAFSLQKQRRQPEAQVRPRAGAGTPQ